MYGVRAFEVPLPTTCYQRWYNTHTDGCYISGLCAIGNKFEQLFCCCVRSGEDLERGRVYLPQEDLRAFGVSERDLRSCSVTPAYIRLMQYQIARARGYYKKASEGIPMLAPSGRFAVQASLDLYGRILDVIERNGYDNFHKRACTTKLEKLSILPQSYYRSHFATGAV
jgi:hypothetical protein